MTEITTAPFTPATARMPGANAKELLQSLSEWGKLTTIIFAGGSVFEFKGPFPKGSEAHGYYNLDSGGEGFEGHLNLERVAHIVLESKLRRGRPAYCFVFADDADSTLFKIFLGRDAQGDIFAHQLQPFQALQAAQSE
ncbi:Uncharacterised protein [BD1-7 clade bacterium]|uniref:Heme utilization cystosolic carrier protein HutX n=1 Tax=BD1-7 clade bacterium TaxID=2029982 RepID=A0A5S9MNM3_9GAMM|nr:Uncharacterised protein [BD1-7 clade bacterium]